MYVKVYTNTYIYKMYECCCSYYYVCCYTSYYTGRVVWFAVTYTRIGYSNSFI
jgi:hypothetical protein